jgi:hypothetical protein
VLTTIWAAPKPKPRIAIAFCKLSLRVAISGIFFQPLVKFGKLTIDRFIFTSLKLLLDHGMNLGTQSVS